MNTAAIGDANTVRFGLAEAVECGPIIVQGDCFVLSESYIGPEGGETLNLNIVVLGEGSTSPSAGVHSYSPDTLVSVSATPSTGWSFDHWVLDRVPVGSVNPVEVVIDGNHLLEAVFSVIQVPVHDVFSVVSNSTVSDLSFDSSGKLLGFTVSGPDGTYGFVEVSISKDLIPDLGGLQVFLDGVEVS